MTTSDALPHSKRSRTILIVVILLVFLSGLIYLASERISGQDNASKLDSTVEIVAIEPVDSEDGERLKISFKVDVHPADRQFTIIALPDTQYYSKFHPEIYLEQTRWIVDNKDRLNIGFVTHLGDVVHDWDDIELQWQRASEAMAILDGQVPYGILAGNHDMQVGGVAEFYEKYFPADRYSDYPWWGGSFRGNKNNFQVLKLGGDDFIFVNLEFCPHNQTLDWAKARLDEYPDSIAIISTHAYLRQNGAVDDSTCSEHSEGHASNNNGVRLWRYVVRQHSNVAMVLNGHFPGEAYMPVDYEGRTIHQILADFQGRERGGNGFLRIMTFFPDRDRVEIQTYSPTLDQYDRGPKNEFELALDLTPLDLPTGEVLIQNGSDQCRATLNIGYCEINAPADGLLHLTAAYAGDSKFFGATSDVMPAP
jgi:hypothetical protein